MSWDDAYNQLEQEFGREPTIDEVQRRMLEIAESRLAHDINNRENETEQVCPLVAGRRVQE